MTEHNHELVRRLFDLAIAASPPDRGPLLERECAGDAALRGRIEAMIAAAEDDRFLGEPTQELSDAAATVDAPAPGLVAAALGEAPGTRIGPYKLLQRIGEGGFGSVFMAEQERPVRRKVALKVIKLGMDTKAVVARFEAERQALALMDHPNIAKVLDAGATETGRPYFVMELCKGDVVTEYCDKNNLSILDRLELFAQVCTAVQHAHTKGIIHRDIKPSNVLVSTQDGRPLVKVIDFGIAKATASKLTEKTLFTEHRQLIGTPEYMSPEQAEGSLDIDMRTDVYSLGVLLYELLTGTTPFSGNELRSAAYAEIQRIIREVEPPRPSTRLSTNTDTLASVAARRHTEPRKLGMIVRGELDWIVMKALEKDRQRRYETANGLAMDIRRYLSGEAVLAAPQSTAYRMRKFVKRHRLQVAAAGLVTIALTMGLAGTTWQARVAAERAEAARKAEGEAKVARDAEKARADELEKVSGFQQRMLAQVNMTAAGVKLSEDVQRRFAESLAKEGLPEGERAGRAREFQVQWAKVNATDAATALIDATILKPAVAAIDAQFKDQPALDARLRQALAERYFDLGLWDAAFPLQKSVLETRRRVLGEEHPETLSALGNMAFLLMSQGKYSEAEPVYREALEKFRRVLGEEHSNTLATINSLGQILQLQNKLGEAEPFQREAMQKSRRVLGEEAPGTINAINNMAALLDAQGKFAEAEPYYRETLEKRRRVRGEEHPHTLLSIHNMGYILEAQGRVEDAEPYYREALEKRRRVLGEDHPHTLGTLNNLGSLLLSRSRLAEAEACLREALEKRRRRLGEAHPNTLGSLNNLGRVLLERGQPGEAEPYLREAMVERRRLLGDDHPDTLNSCMSLGRLLNETNRAGEALGLLSSAESAARRAFVGGNSRRLAVLLSALGRARVNSGFEAERFRSAEANLLEAYPILVKTGVSSNKEAIGCVRNLVELYEAWDKGEPGKGHGVKAAEWRAKLDAAESGAKRAEPTTTEKK